MTDLPVIGVPFAVGPLNGLDALLATVQVPPGVPVATVGSITRRTRHTGDSDSEGLNVSP